MTQINIDTLALAQGSHDSDDGTCLYEAYNLLRFDRHTDTCPVDVSPVLHRYGIALNDALPDGPRQGLKRFLPRPDGTDPLAGTAGDGLDEARSYLALDWLVRTYTPAWLDLAGLPAEAQSLRDLRRLVDMEAAQAAGPVTRSARSAATAAATAPWDAARAARAAAGDAAGAAARAAVAGDAARAAWAAAWAAGDAAWDYLAPTVTTLQQSAIGLFDAMIRPAAVPTTS